MDWFLYDNGLRHERVNHLSEELLKALHSCLSSELTLSLSTRVILFIFIPLSDKKGFIDFQTFYYLLLCLALRCYSTSFFLSFFLSYKTYKKNYFVFLYNRKLSTVLVLILKDPIISRKLYWDKN